MAKGGQVRKMMDLNNVDVVYNLLIEDGYFTEAELELVTCINGYNMETLNDCIYCRYGFRSLDQMMNFDELKIDC